MNILENVTPQQILALVLTIYLVICIVGYLSGIRKLILKLKSVSNFKPYLKGEIPNPGFPKLLFKQTTIKRKINKK
ncbi:MAG: hypothetical protein WCO33_04705, partial [bacterium]